MTEYAATPLATTSFLKYLQEVSSTETSPQTTFNDLPSDIVNKINDHVNDLYLQDHKKNFECTLEAIPEVAKVLWKYCYPPSPFMPISIENYYGDEEEQHVIDEVLKFLPHVQTDLDYYHIQDYIVQTAYFHDSLVNIQ